ncbi:MAG: hypothetical protein R3251_03075 [Candidatus Spechtbacterales bacterium]|nr:hypothetical protein [Candidatus Spechtbacterales bacterium]
MKCPHGKHEVLPKKTGITKKSFCGRCGGSLGEDMSKDVDDKRLFVFNSKPGIWSRLFGILRGD